MGTTVCDMVHPLAFSDARAEIAPVSLTRQRKLPHRTGHSPTPPFRTEQADAFSLRFAPAERSACATGESLCCSPLAHVGLQADAASCAFQGALFASMNRQPAFF